MSKNKECCPKFKTMCGGQALIEGIMMRGPEKEAIVVRKPDGELEVKVEPLKLVKSRHPILGWPLIRGPINFIDSMVHGVKALMYSAQFFPEEEETEKEKARREKREAKQRAKAEKKGKPLPEEKGDKPLSEAAMGAVVTFSVILGLGFSILLFFMLPFFLSRLAQDWLGVNSQLALSLIEGLVRMVIFLVYLILMSKLKDMKRVFRYHGAEHQTIFCYENGLPLTVENVREMPRHHPRCGTSFLFVIMFVAILIHAALSPISDNRWVLLAVRLLSLPVIVSITYEINRFVGRHDNWLTRILTAPGLWLQNWTTQEPDDTMIEVGIRALSEVLPEEKGADAW